jgi:predicted acyltransferase
VRAVLRRAAVLVLLGLLLQSFPWLSLADGTPLLQPLWSVRVPGVLQRIGACYAAAALLFVCAGRPLQRRVLGACLLLYWPLLALCPTPDGGAPDLGSQGDHVAGWLDRAVFGSHTWGGRPYDPEGLLSTIPAVATTLLGVCCGRVLASGAPRPEQVRTLLLQGAGWTALGAVWGWVFPINKALWTSSYALFTAGIAATGLGMLLYWFEERGRQRLLRPLVVYGRNALLVFVGSGLLARTLGRLLRFDDGGRPVSAQRWLHEHLLLSWAEPHFASLLYALLWVAGWYLVLAWLYRRGVIWRV